MGAEQSCGMDRCCDGKDGAMMKVNKQATQREAAFSSHAPALPPDIVALNQAAPQPGVGRTMKRCS